LARGSARVAVAVAASGGFGDELRRTLLLAVRPQPRLARRGGLGPRYAPPVDRLVRV